MMKQDFQRAVLNRIHRMSTDPSAQLDARSCSCATSTRRSRRRARTSRPATRSSSPSRGRRSAFRSSRPRASARSGPTLPGESWRTLLQGLRTKIFLALSDDFSAHMAADLCGKAERLKPSYTITEAGQDARVSMLTGRPAAHRTTVSAAKTYSLQLDYVFQPKVFAELQNAQAIVLPYDGLNPLPPTYCYLKPHYLDVQTQLLRPRREGSALT